MTNKNIMCVLLLSTSLAACGGGGAKPVLSVSAPVAPSPAPTPSPTPTPAQVEDNRYAVETVVKQYDLKNHGNTAVEYSTAPLRPSSEFPRTDKYKIADHGFFQVRVTGMHDGVTVQEDPLEPAAPGAWQQGSHIIEANINGDEHSDFYMFEYIRGSRDDRPNAYVHAWVNDGKGHFKLANSSVFADGEICIANGSLNNRTDPDSPCGYYTGYMRHPIVEDFNGDGIDDIYYTSILHVSKDGVLENRSRSGLPDFFFDSTYVGPVFAHDNAAGDADGDGDVDIFVPVEQSSRAGYKNNGQRFDNCDDCNQRFPWAMLINDGAGNFSLNQNFPIFGLGNNPLLGNVPSMYVPTDPAVNGAPLALTAAIADFDNDGFGDVAVGWKNPGVTAYWGLGTNSAGAVYYNDGNNDWRNRDTVILPANWYGANGSANDMVAMDFDKDGKMDIVLAVTKQNPYYQGRMVQMFRNTNGVNFEDVTNTANPVTKYAEGSGTPWWNGEGVLNVLDFDKDGCEDVVDSTYNTYVLLGNCRGQFELYEDFPGITENGHRSPLYPVELDSKWQYDFVGYTYREEGDVGTTTYFQVLDPPSLSEQIQKDLYSRPTQYARVAEIANRAYSDIFYHSRMTTNQATMFANQTDRAVQSGISGHRGQFGLTLMNISGRDQDPQSSISHNTTAFASTFEHDQYRLIVAFSDSNFDVSAASQFFGAGRSGVDATTVGAELTYAFNFGDWNLRTGGRYNRTQVSSFEEISNTGTALNFSAQTYSSVASVIAVDYRRVWQVSPWLTLQGAADFEAVSHVYRDQPSMQFNTGLGSSLTAVGQNSSRMDYNMSYSVGAVINNKLGVNFVVANAAEMPMYTLSVSSSF